VRMRRVPAGTRRGLRALFVLAVLVFFASLGGTAYAADVAPPSMPTGATAATGSAMPIVARVTWIAATDNVGVDGYHVYRAAALAGPYQRIGTSAGASYDDKTGVVGKDYWYEVSAYDAAGNESAQSLPTNPIKAAWTVTPHATFVGTDLCGSCHAPHRALTARNIFRNASSAQGELSTCYACHDGTSASTNIKAGPANSFVLSSGHTMESRIDTTTPADLANSCSDCHSPHKNYLTRPLLWKSQVNTTTVTGADTTWCLSCHNDAQDWYVKKYGSAYPTLTPTLDASGFPIAGTFTGRTIYTSATANAHSTIPTSGSDRVRGDCRYCHATHRGPAKYDALLATLTVPTAATLASDRANGDYAAACFACHGGGAWVASGAVDIKQFATYNGASSVVYSGHRIKSATASAPVDAPLPCFACHNPHGSGRGNNSLITDTLGKSLDTSTAAGNEAVRPSA
jgi:predicted CXXCH cytochrome family protein